MNVHEEGGNARRDSAPRRRPWSADRVVRGSRFSKGAGTCRASQHKARAPGPTSRACERVADRRRV
jgi:hypothetical protein